MVGSGMVCQLLSNGRRLWAIFAGLCLKPRCSSGVAEMNVESIQAPQEIEATSIRKGLLEDLALKILYLNGEMSLPELGNHMCLSLGVIEGIFQFFRKEQLCEVKGMSGGSHRIIASDRGKSRAAD